VGVKEMKGIVTFQVKREKLGLEQGCGNVLLDFWSLWHQKQQCQALNKLHQVSTGGQLCHGNTTLVSYYPGLTALRNFLPGETCYFTVDDRIWKMW